MNSKVQWFAKCKLKQKVLKKKKKRKAMGEEIGNPLPCPETFLATPPTGIVNY